jgi:hypothetical protein
MSEFVKKRLCCCFFREKEDDDKPKKMKREVEEWEKCFGHDRKGNRTICWETPKEWGKHNFILSRTLLRLLTCLGKVFLGLFLIYAIMGGLWIALWYIYIAIRHTS